MVDGSRGCFPPALPTETRFRQWQRPVELLHHDVRNRVPAGPFDLALCRNLVFTYFSEELQREVGGHLVRSLRPGGALVVGAHEAVLLGLNGLEPGPKARTRLFCWS